MNDDPASVARLERELAELRHDDAKLYAEFQRYKTEAQARIVELETEIIRLQLLVAPPALESSARILKVDFGRPI